MERGAAGAATDAIGAAGAAAAATDVIVGAIVGLGGAAGAIGTVIGAVGVIIGAATRAVAGAEVRLEVFDGSGGIALASTSGEGEFDDEESEPNIVAGIFRSDGTLMTFFSDGGTG